MGFVLGRRELGGALMPIGTHLEGQTFRAWLDASYGMDDAFDEAIENGWAYTLLVLDFGPQGVRFKRSIFDDVDQP